MLKTELRQLYKTKRQELSEHDRSEASLQIANQLLKLPIWEHQTYHVFCSIQRFFEIDTSFLMSILMGKDKNIVVSKTIVETLSLQHFLLTDNTTFVVNSWGIPEPQGGLKITSDQIEVVFVPLLISDSFGHRVGYGKGFYDRFLQDCSKNVVKVGINHFEPIQQITDVTPADVALDYLVTPQNIYAYNP